MRQLQSGNASLINTADNFHIKELDWKSKTMYLLFQVASPEWLNGYLNISQKMCLIHHIPESKIRHRVS